MMNILDLHTHLPAPRPDAVISCNPEELPSREAFPGQLYSVGIHPWRLTFSGLTEEEISLLTDVASRPDVVAIGETGIDKVRDGTAPLFAQMTALKAHIELSESLRKPLILHCVKAHDIIIGLRKEMKPTQRWVVHGFRGKPTILRQLLDVGIDVSYGEMFNPESVAQTLPARLFAETDESALPIREIIGRLSEINPAITPDLLKRNIADLLTVNC